MYYEGLAYESHPANARQADLVERMMDDEPFLTNEELKVLPRPFEERYCINVYTQEVEFIRVQEHDIDVPDPMATNDTSTR